MTAPITIRRGGDNITPEELAALVAVFHALASQPAPEAAAPAPANATWTRAAASGTTWSNRPSPGWKPVL